jgi:hypothetical protein
MKELNIYSEMLNGTYHKSMENVGEKSCVDEKGVSDYLVEICWVFRLWNSGKQSKIEYIQTCANYLYSTTVDARNTLTINNNECAKFFQGLKNLTKRISKLKQN